jgi:hypothetical protein
LHGKGKCDRLNRTTNNKTKPHKHTKRRTHSQRTPQIPVVTSVYKGNLISVNIQNHSYHGLVDTGAAISCISSSLVESLHHVIINPPKYLKVQGVGGNKIEVKGQITLEFEIENKVFIHDFTILPTMTHDLIIGKDFLQLQQAEISFGNNTLNFPDLKVNFIQASQTKSFLLRSAEQLLIAPKSEQLIKVKGKYLDTVGVGMFEPLTSLVTKKCLLGARCVVKLGDGSQKWFRVFNPNNVSVTITKNQPVAKFTLLPTHSIQEYNPENIPSVNMIEVKPDESYIKIAQELGVTIENPNLSNFQKQQLLTLIGQNRDCFAKDMSELSTTKLYEHSIETGNSKPIRQRFYKVSPITG